MQQIGLIGEAVKRLSGELQDNNAHIPWQDIGYAGQALHDYFDVDIELVWLTAQPCVEPTPTLALSTIVPCPRRYR